MRCAAASRAAFFLSSFGAVEPRRPNIGAVAGRRNSAATAGVDWRSVHGGVNVNAKRDLDLDLERRAGRLVASKAPPSSRRRRARCRRTVALHHVRRRDRERAARAE